ncbi:putative interactor of JAZ [Wolffia australiana]
MEDENGIELSLGLSCGGSSSRSKVKDSPVVPITVEGSRAREIRLEPSLRPFIPLSAVNPETHSQQQVSNLFGEKSGLHKRKSSAEHASPQKKLDRAYVPLTKEDNSSGDLDDGAESETEGSSSWMGPQVDRNSSGVTIDHGKSTLGSNPCSFQPLVFQASSSMRQLAPPFRSSNQAFGYSPVQLPTLETPSSWIFGSHQSPHSENSSRSSPAGVVEAGDEPEREERQQAGLMGLERWSIKPGIGANMLFGGSGTRPDLPWVSTTGPTGWTISGVTYKYSSSQVRIVCACHGTHHTPEEFIQHASGHPQENHSSSNNNSVAPG